jgi:hypothetical protein
MKNQRKKLKSKAEKRRIIVKENVKEDVKRSLKEKNKG